jgi:hypothetical protein
VNTAATEFDLKNSSPSAGSSFTILRSAEYTFGSRVTATKGAAT